MLLLIDNFDSFTYNLYHYLLQLNKQVTVIRSDKISIELVTIINPEAIIISPGPSKPSDYPILFDIIKHFKQKKILGICLGFQVIVEYFGGKIIKDKKPHHGYISTLYHNNNNILCNIPNNFKATRYHSLIAEKKSFPHTELQINAYSEDKVIQAISHKQYNIYGLQFHPESICSEYGLKILENFLLL